MGVVVAVVVAVVVMVVVMVVVVALVVFAVWYLLGISSRIIVVVFGVGVDDTTVVVVIDVIFVNMFLFAVGCPFVRSLWC